MTPARMRRLSSDYEEIKKNFAGHKNIIVTPEGDEPPEKYHVTYFVNGIYLLPDGKVETLGRHEVEITLHAEYPRYKPICRILTPIWHPNFRDGQICIGDIWGAGESLSDIIVNIGDMIQYKSWNSFSPLSSEAAKWAIENKHLFPVGNVDLFYSDYASAKDTVEIDLFDENETPEDPIAPAPVAEPVYPSYSAPQRSDPAPAFPTYSAPQSSDPAPEYAPAPSAAGFYYNGPSQTTDTGNDFDITEEELAGIEFVPTAQRIQTQNTLVKGKRLSFKTVFVKGLLWALIGALVGFVFAELLTIHGLHEKLADIAGYSYLAQGYKYQDLADKELGIASKDFYAYCRKYHHDKNDQNAYHNWYYYFISDDAERHLDKYSEYSLDCYDYFNKSYKYEFNNDDDLMDQTMERILKFGMGLFSGIIALFIGLFLGIGEGVYYGSKTKALKYAAIGAGVSLIIGLISGYFAQWMYAAVLKDDSGMFVSSLIRGIAWAIMGLGIGLAVGLIKPEKRRVLFCTIGGFIGAFLGGFVFNYVFELIPDDTISRCVAILITGALIGLGVGLLEQAAKQAWLKVIRGEFEGKEYLVFAGTTSIGNNGKNTIVLFKDKLVGPHHCDIVQEGRKYTIVDCGTPMGTIVNGARTTRQVLRQGDTISIGNSVLVFNTK